MGSSNGKRQRSAVSTRRRHSARPPLPSLQHRRSCSKTIQGENPSLKFHETGLYSFNPSRTFLFCFFCPSVPITRVSGLKSSSSPAHCRMTSGQRKTYKVGLTSGPITGAEIEAALSSSSVCCLLISGRRQEKPPGHWSGERRHCAPHKYLPSLQSNNGVEKCVFTHASCVHYHL